MVDLWATKCHVEEHGGSSHNDTPSWNSQHGHIQRSWSKKTDHVADNQCWIRVIHQVIQFCMVWGIVVRKFKNIQWLASPIYSPNLLLCKQLLHLYHQSYNTKIIIVINSMHQVSKNIEKVIFVSKGQLINCDKTTDQIFIWKTVLIFLSCLIDYFDLCGHYFSNWASWQCGSSQSLEEPFAILVLDFPPPTSSLKFSNLFSRPVVVLRSASFNFCFNRCLRLAGFKSCFDCDGGAPCGPRYIIVSSLTWTWRNISKSRIELLRQMPSPESHLASDFHFHRIFTAYPLPWPTSMVGCADIYIKRIY